MKKLLIVLIIVSFLGISSQFGKSLIFRTGFQKLDMNLNFWELKLEDLSISNKSMQGIFFGIGYEYFLSQKIAINIEGGIYEKIMHSTQNTNYNIGMGRTQIITLNIYSVELNINWLPIGYRKKIYPYLGAGGGLYIWKYKQTEAHFNTGIPRVVYSGPFGEIVSMGFNVKTGIIFRVGKKLGLSLEGKYRYQRGLAISTGVYIFIW